MHFLPKAYKLYVYQCIHPLNGIHVCALDFFFQDVSFFGMVQGNKEGGGGRAIDIVLPNGKMCPISDQDIPHFDADEPRYAHGLLEHRSVIYMVAGIDSTGELSE